jgi:NADH dehydrogenase
MAAISRRRAVVSFHGLRVAGFLGWLMWLFVHLAFLTGFKNRFKTIVSWTLSFLGTGRTERALIRIPNESVDEAVRKDQPRMFTGR